MHNTVQGIEITYADACIRALLAARRGLMYMPVVQATAFTKYGKRDTRGLDSGTEIAIKEHIRRFKDDAILVTEETDEEFGRHWPANTDFPVVFICDPTDRSKYLDMFLKEASKKEQIGNKKVGELLYGCNREEVWRNLFAPGKDELPLSIVSPTSAITCVRRGRPLFTAIVNYLTDQIFIAGPTGVFSLNLPDYHKTEAVNEINFTFITNHGTRLYFPSATEMCPAQDDHLRFATFLGKAGYQENFDATAIFLGQTPETFRHHAEPGGPSRVLYLSELQKGFGPMGFVMANGEKIGEFVHWLPFVIYGTTHNGQRALALYEVSIERPWTKEGVLMSTSPPYSIFREQDGNHGHYLDVRRLRKFEHPSHFRSTIVVTQADNNPLCEIMGTHCYREIQLA